jgi:hypothetical protein
VKRFLSKPLYKTTAGVIVLLYAVGVARAFDGAWSFVALVIGCVVAHIVDDLVADRWQA